MQVFEGVGHDNTSIQMGAGGGQEQVDGGGGKNRSTTIVKPMQVFKGAGITIQVFKWGEKNRSTAIVM